MVDDAKVKYICDIYDWDGKGEIDLFFLGDVMYALGLNVTKKVCVGLGQTDEEGKKFAKYDDVVEKVKAAVATPDSQVVKQDFNIQKNWPLPPDQRNIIQELAASSCIFFTLNKSSNYLSVNSEKTDHSYE